MPRPRHRPSVGRALAAASAALALLSAQAAPPTPESLGVAVARELLAATDADNALITELASEAFAREHGLAETPGWRLRLREAAVEEVEHDRPELERRAGRALAATFTVTELLAIDAFLKSPAGQALIAYLADSAAGLPARAPTGEAQAEVERFLSTPEGRAFRDELEDPGPQIERLEDDAKEELIPGVLQRFREKTAAGGG